MRYGVNIVPGQPDPGLPVLAIVPDWMTDLSAFFRMDVALWRIFNRDSFKLLPANAHVVGWNEADEAEVDWRIEWVRQIRNERPDLVIHHGAWNVNGLWPVEVGLVNACDVLDVHMGTQFSVPPAVLVDTTPISINSNLVWRVEDNPTTIPVWVTEVEVDPMRMQDWSEIVPCMQRLDAAGHDIAFAWGMTAGYPDVHDHEDILEQLRALNAGKEPSNVTMEELEKRVAALEQRDALLTQGFRRLLLGEYEGASGAAADVVALQGGVDDVTGKVRLPLFP